MKTNFLGLRTTIYFVPDLNKAKEWYAKAFQVQPYFDEPFYVGFNIGGYELGLHPLENRKAGEPGCVETYWGVENINTVYEHLLAQGATTHQAPNNVGGSIEVATVLDPWGNILGIIYNPEFKAE